MPITRLSQRRSCQPKQADALANAMFWGLTSPPFSGRMSLKNDSVNQYVYVDGDVWNIAVQIYLRNTCTRLLVISFPTSN